MPHRRSSKKLNFLIRTTLKAFKETDKTEINVKQHLLPSIHGKNHTSDGDRSFFELPLRLGG